MHLSRRHLVRIAIGAVVAAFVISLAGIPMLLNTYGCAGTTASCSTLSQADNTRIHIGLALQGVCAVIFIISLLALLRLWVTKKERL